MRQAHALQMVRGHHGGRVARSEHSVSPERGRGTVIPQSEAHKWGETDVQLLKLHLHDSSCKLKQKQKHMSKIVSNSFVKEPLRREDQL